MSHVTVICDQAIFTSIRTAMGEGYRIIAASKGLRPDEKQTITRNSPSHDALCVPPNRTSTPHHLSKTPIVQPGAQRPGDYTDDTLGFAFYALPGGRLCTACSGFAGAEHTGRGGQRIYTINVVFPQESFPACGYNPFRVLRAMHSAGLTKPQLAPSTHLPELKLNVSAGPCLGSAWRERVSSPARRAILQSLLTDRSLILNLDADWIETAEAILLGIPGPMRARVSLCAGLKYSAGRNHRLHLLHDSGSTTRNRSAGQRLEYHEPATMNPTLDANSAWLTFVDRHWERADFETLSSRTSRGFRDISVEARERAGRWFNALDEAPKTESGKLLSMLVDSLEPRTDPVECQIIGDLHVGIQRVLLDRFQAMTWPQVALFWPVLTQVWRRGEAGCAFAQPLVVSALRRAMREDPPAAAGAAIQVARDIPAFAQSQGHASLLDDVLHKLADWAGQVKGAQLGSLRNLLQQWRLNRPHCPIIQRIQDALCGAPALG